MGGAREGAAAGPGLDDAAAELQSWASGVLGDTKVVLGPPAGAVSQDQVSLHLLQIDGHPPPRGPRRPPLQVDLHFLVSAASPRPEAELRMVGELLFAAMARDDLEVELGPVTPAVWRSLDAVPRAAFILKMPFRRELPDPRAPRVRAPLVVKAVAGEPLTGQVLGPGDIPIAGAVVEFPALRLSSRSGPDGRFRFAHVPLDPPPRLIVRAKGESQTFVAPDSSGAPLTIHFRFQEG